jgi:hypothetical protein
LNFNISKISKNIFFKPSLLFFSSLTVLIKWIILFNYFDDENLLNKLIFDIEDFYYFPHIINLLEFDFSPDYLENFKSKNYLPIPLYSIIFHAISIKIFGYVSFLFLEFLCLYLFLSLIVIFFSKLDINYNLAFIVGIFIFLLPAFFNYLEFLNLKTDTFNNFFSFRFPRPLITSLYFLWGLYLAIKYYFALKEDFQVYLLIGISLALNFVSYYYSFILLSLIFSTVFLIKINQDKKYLAKNYLKILISMSLFILLIFPFLILFLISEPDYLSMIGVISLDINTKVELLTYLLKRLLGYKFFPIILITLFSSLMLLKLNIKLIKKKVTFLLILFFSSILSPIFFIIISNSISEIYHFLNWIVIISAFVLISNFILALNYYLEKNYLTKNIRPIISLFAVIFFLIFQFDHYKNLKLIDKSLRKDFLKLQNFIDKNDNELNNFMTFIPRAQVLLMLKNKKIFTTIESSFSSLNFSQLEKSFIQNLKYIGVNKDDFIKIIENKKVSWRYNNNFVRYFSWYKYQANSLITYKDSSDFSKLELEHISNSSPTRTQQIIIPKFEIKRLIDLYDNLSLNENFNSPDLIILDKKSMISKFSNINYDEFCEIKGFTRLKVYSYKELMPCN